MGRTLDLGYGCRKDLCVFTTHTPIEAGHDRFSYDLVKKVIGEIIPLTLLKKLGGEQSLNMTLLALNLSNYINGVAKNTARSLSPYSRVMKSTPLPTVFTRLPGHVKTFNDYTINTFLAGQSNRNSSFAQKSSLMMNCGRRIFPPKRPV